MQSGAFENLQNIRRLSGQLSDTTRVPSSNVIARMSLDASQYPQSHGLYPASSSTSSHTMSALHSQPFRLEDVTVQQNVAPPLNSQMNRPVASAFQQLSSQDCTSFLPFADYTQQHPAPEKSLATNCLLSRPCFAPPPTHSTTYVYSK